MGLVAGKWPHSLAFQPGGTTRTLDLGGRMRLRAIIRDVRTFFEAVVLGVDVERFLDFQTPEALAVYAETGGATCRSSCASPPTSGSTGSVPVRAR